MAGTWTETPRSERLHIGIFGKRNNGKSSLINALTGQTKALVSPVAGTTTDPVYQPMELFGVGPAVWIDTAGYDDEGELGALRIKKTVEAADKTDIAVLVFSCELKHEDLEWFSRLKDKKIPVIPVFNLCEDLSHDYGKQAEISLRVEQFCGRKPVVVNVKTGLGLPLILDEVKRLIPEDYGAASITGAVIGQGDLVMLVMPQDIQAPKGRLILPQVQTLRELLDRKCPVMCVTTDKLKEALAMLNRPPRVIITDSQDFKVVYQEKPEESLLTSFSVLFADYKGDLNYFVEGARAMEGLTESSHVLIAEACTHAPQTEDIGRVKIPGLLSKRFGEGIKIDMVSGQDFPEDLSQYQLIIHCGACMFNRAHVISRVDRARESGIPMTNYGVAIAFLTGILDYVWTGV